MKSTFKLFLGLQIEIVFWQFIFESINADISALLSALLAKTNWTTFLCSFFHSLCFQLKSNQIKQNKCSYLSDGGQVIHNEQHSLASLLLQLCMQINKPNQTKAEQSARDLNLKISRTAFAEFCLGHVLPLPYVVCCLSGYINVYMYICSLYLLGLAYISAGQSGKHCHMCA